MELGDFLKFRGHFQDDIIWPRIVGVFADADVEETVFERDPIHAVVVVFLDPELFDERKVGAVIDVNPRGALLAGPGEMRADVQFTVRDAAVAVMGRNGDFLKFFAVQIGLDQNVRERPEDGLAVRRKTLQVVLVIALAPDFSGGKGSDEKSQKEAHDDGKDVFHGELGVGC